MPDRALRYNIRHGGEEIKLSISIISIDSSCVPRSNIDLTYRVWTLSEFFCTNYKIVVLPSQTSGDKIVYVRPYWTAIWGLTSRRCGRCVCLLDDSLPHYYFGCRYPEKCPCVLCCRQLTSLKAAASESVFGLCNKEKGRLDQVTSCSSVEYYPEYDSNIEFCWATSLAPSSSPLTVRDVLPGVAVSRDAALQGLVSG